MAELNNFGFRRKSGILMPIFSLPSKYGIGSFGKEAKDFVDFLADCRQRCWQVLPLGQTSYADSPYQSVSSASLNPYFLDLETLHGKGLLTKEELSAQRFDSERIDYGRLFFTRFGLLRIAYSRFKPDRSYSAFLKREAEWVNDYSLFMALKVKNGYRPWYEWEESEKDVSKAKAKGSVSKKELGFWSWLQYELDSQWRELRGYAHSKGISIIGDLPIYVAHDSVDVWSAPEQFMLDEQHSPKFVAGCPPDAYAEDGQLWGNPIYDWDFMKRDGFTWWLDRVGRSFRLFDILRIDHFRGFASYWSIPFGDENAKRGSWVSAPGEELFLAIRKAYPKSKIIAEDLGMITDDVRELLAKTGFPGMKLLQFAFYSSDSEYLPKNYTTDNCVVYTGSHDSDCTRSWAAALSGQTLANFRAECKREKGESATAALVRLAMRSCANLAIIPIQDYMELPNETARINTPSVAEGNWTFRISKRYNTEKLRNKITSITVSSRRAVPKKN